MSDPARHLAMPSDENSVDLLHLNLVVRTSLEPGARIELATS